MENITEKEFAFLQNVSSGKIPEEMTEREFQLVKEFNVVGNPNTYAESDISHPGGEGFFQRSKNFLRDIGLSVSMAGASTVAGIGGVLEIMGSRMKERKENKENIEEKLLSLGFPALLVAKKTANLIGKTSLGATLEKFGRKIEEYGDREAEFLSKFRDNEKFKGDFLDNPSWYRAANAVASAIPSLGMSFIASAATGNPLVGGAFLGLVETEDIYDKAIKEGLTEDQAFALFGTGAVGVTAMESTGLGAIQKTGVMGKIAGIITGTAGEGLTEAGQQLYQNMVVKYGINDTQSLFEGVIESLIAGAGSGGIAASFNSGGNVDKVVKKMKDSGATDTEINGVVQVMAESIEQNADEIDDAILKAAEAKSEKISEIAADQAEEVVQKQPNFEIAEKVIKTGGKEYTMPMPIRHKDIVSKYGLTEENLMEAEFGYINPEGEYFTDEDIIVNRKKAIESGEPSLMERLNNVRETYKKKETISLKEAKEVQGEIISVIKKSQLTQKDKSKFIVKIKNVQTLRQFNREISNIKNRISNLETAQEARALRSVISKEVKKTAPIKKGQRVIGKYDYSTNKIVEQIKKYSGLKRADAERTLESYVDTGDEGIDLINKRFLELKSLGAKASVSLHRQVLEDIKRIKEIGKIAKDEQDFLNRIQRSEELLNAQKALNANKANKETMQTKAVSTYIRGLANTWSMLNAIFNKDVADKYNTELAENARDVGVATKTREVAEAGEQILQTNNLMKYFSNMAKDRFEITDNDGLVYDLTKIEIIDIYNAIKNPTIRDRYYNNFGEQQINAIIDKLSAQEIDFADYMQGVAESYYDVFNENNIRITGRDLGKMVKYWPSTSKHKTEIYDDIKTQGETPSAQKARVQSGRVKPVPMNAWDKLMRHIAQGEHVKNLSQPYENLKRLVSDEVIEHEIKRKFGDEVHRDLSAQVDEVSLGRHIETLDAITGVIGGAINNWVRAKVALNPDVFVKQLISVGNYMETMPVKDWTAKFFEGVSPANAKKTFDFMWQNAPFLKARFNKGYSEALQAAVGGSDSIHTNKNEWGMFLSSLVRAGDITAIVYGGYPLVKHEMAKGKTKEQAFKIFEQATLRSQQSGLASSRSRFQNINNPLARLFLSFKNTPKQYARKTVDAIMMFNRGEISKSELAKTLVIYNVIQPSLYAFAGSAMNMLWKSLGGKFDEEDVEEIPLKIASQIALSPITAVPIISDAARFGIREATGQKNWKAISTPVLDDLNIMFRKLGKKEITAKDWFKILSTPAELTTGIPIKKYESLHRKVFVK